MQGTLFIISAPSGAGKTTLINVVLEHLDGSCRLQRVVTYTSKQPRAGEIDGKDYHFVSKEVFEKRINESFFIEWSTAYGTYYGSPAHIKQGLQAGKSFVLIVDRVGAQQIFAQLPQAVLIWIYTADVCELKRRLKKRGTESDEQIHARIEQAQVEIDLEQRNALYHYHILNDNFNKAVEQLKQVIQRELTKNNTKL